MSIYIGSHIADIHVGAMDPDDLLFQIKSAYIKQLRKLPKLDYIIIHGDTYDHKLGLDSKHSKCAFKIMDEITDLALDKGAKVRIIEGTDSHDGSQIENFMMYQKKLDFRIIRTVTEEYLFEDFRVLYIPEEYMGNPKKYYAPYFEEDDRYNMIFGHGQVKETSFMKQESELSKLDSPIFDVIEFNRICKGPIILGHIHTMMNLYNSVFYPGSFDCWCQGEEHRKGTLLSVYNTDNPSKFIVTPIYNRLARKYKTKFINNIIEKYEVEEVYQAILDFIKVKNIYKLRLKVTDTSVPEVSAKIAILKSMISNNKKIDLVIESLMINREEEEQKQIVEEYNYLFDNSLGLEEKVQLFIKNEFEYDITTEKINTILFDPNYLKDLGI